MAAAPTPETHASSQEHFRPYREALGLDWFETDPILRRWVDRQATTAAARPFLQAAGRDAATRHRDRADLVERAENAPRLAPGQGVVTAENVVLPDVTRAALAEAHGSGIWAPAFDPRARYAALYLWAQNGEAGIMCSLACTDGLARALAKLGTTERDRKILAALDASTPASFVHGAQFVTEIQGGSDAGANRVAAQRAQDGLHLLYGQKWFCSNLTADYWLVTARPVGAPEGARGVGLFLVPRQWEGKPNGHVVERLKEKVGTRALATAELRFQGAKAWALGPLDHGLRNTVGIVLATSRIHNVLASAALLRAATREATAYARFRVAFGRPIAEQPLIAEVLQRLAHAADRTEAGAFALVDLWLATSDVAPDAPAAVWRRVLISIAKAVTARRASRLLYDAMMVLAGNGIEERFSPLPRLWRDAAIFETWEGPYTLLLMQALEDLAKYVGANRAESFLLETLGPRTAERFGATLHRILERPDNELLIREWAMLAPLLLEQFEFAAATADAPT